LYVNRKYDIKRGLIFCFILLVTLNLVSVVLLKFYIEYLDLKVSLFFRLLTIILLSVTVTRIFKCNKNIEFEKDLMYFIRFGNFYKVNVVAS